MASPNMTTNGRRAAKAGPSQPPNTCTAQAPTQYGNRPSASGRRPSSIGSVHRVLPRAISSM